MAKNSQLTDSAAFPKDRLFAVEQNIGDFVFDKRVADVFPDMIQRSVPGYTSIIAMIKILAQRHVTPKSNVYDLGCSLGAASSVMLPLVEEKESLIVAVDNAQAMIDKAQRNISPADNIEFFCADIRDIEITNASLVVLNFTLQFLPREERLLLLSKIREGMLPGGVLVLSEKIKGKDAEEDKVLTDLHHAFKKANGYSDLEISQKRTALENVLLPETISTHSNRLKQAGFSKVHLWFQCFNFVSLTACP